MNHAIAQLAALTCHANAFLAGREIPPLLASNSTCRFCDRIEFVQDEAAGVGRPIRRILAEDPDEWIHALPLRDVDGVRMTFGPRNDPAISDRLSAGFSGGGHVWALEVVRDDGQTEFWSSDWQVYDREAPDRRIWRVAYLLIATRASQRRPGRNLAIVKTAFRDSLEEILHFSERCTQGAFSTNFRQALAVLADRYSEAGYHDDIAMPGQLGPDADALLRAAMRAWVFGGMGSWNDMSFEQPVQTEYENVSDRLFDVLHEAIEASVTSSYLTS